MCCSGCFFFQAEDGIRGIGVTGVQTCALPISDRSRVVADADHVLLHGGPGGWTGTVLVDRRVQATWAARRDGAAKGLAEIGSASWRERVYISVDAVSIKKTKAAIVQEDALLIV